MEYLDATAYSMLALGYMILAARFVLHLL